MWQLTSQKHYHVKPDKLEEAMITSLNAFMTSIDPHAGILSPKTYKAMLESTQGEFVGIGIVIDNTRKTKDKFLTVVDIVPDGPADKAGLKPLDKIIEVDGHQLEGMSTEEATTKIKGERKTKVHIKILRDKEKDLLSFDITRDMVKDQNALSFYLPDHHIYYLSLNMFSENAVKQIEELLNKAKEQKYRALILDLRNNSGGLLDAVVEIVGMFVPKGSTVVFTKDKDNKEIARYRTQRDPVTKKLPPIFVLTNNYTASAAEILTGCLKIHASQAKNGNLMAFVVGTDSFGKGTVQE